MATSASKNDDNTTTTTTSLMINKKIKPAIMKNDVSTDIPIFLRSKYHFGVCSNVEMPVLATEILRVCVFVA